MKRERGDEASVPNVNRSDNGNALFCFGGKALSLCLSSSLIVATPPELPLTDPRHLLTELTEDQKLTILVEASAFGPLTTKPHRDPVTRVRRLEWGQCTHHGAQMMLHSCTASDICLTYIIET
jgi:hypothetical protein